MKFKNPNQFFAQVILNLATLLGVGFMLFVYSAWAAPLGQNSIPGVISYQGMLTNSSGQPVNSAVNLTFRLYNVSSGGTALWTETHTGVPVQSGLFNVRLGSVTAVPDTVWNNNPLYLGIKVGSEAEMSPRERLASVPFAMQAKVALTVPDGSIDTQQLADGAVTFAKLDATAWTDLPLASGFHSPLADTKWQKAQYRKIGDIVYLRGSVEKDSDNIGHVTNIATLPAGFHPPKWLTFVAEPHILVNVNNKHRVDVLPDGNITIWHSAGATPWVSLDGVFFSVSP